jgi:hypothetical protein
LIETNHLFDLARSHSTTAAGEPSFSDVLLNGRLIDLKSLNQVRDTDSGGVTSHHLLDLALGHPVDDPLWRCREGLRRPLGDDIQEPPQKFSLFREV